MTHQRPEGASQGTAQFDFRSALTATIPQLRAFARGLCGRADVADDLVQETMMKAWAARDRYDPGSSMKAWTFVILRNTFLSEMRRNRFRGDYDEATVEQTLNAAASQHQHLQLAEVHRALQALSTEQREALLLVGAGGFSYEEAAEICECAIGTIKSRVGRARQALEDLLESGKFPSKNNDDVKATDAHEVIMRDVTTLSRLSHK